MSKTTKEARERAVWGSTGREFQADRTASAKALRWEHDGHGQGIWSTPADWSGVDEGARGN